MYVCCSSCVERNLKAINFELKVELCSTLWQRPMMIIMIKMMELRNENGADTGRQYQKKKRTEDRKRTITGCPSVVCSTSSLSSSYLFLIVSHYFGTTNT